MNRPAISSAAPSTLRELRAGVVQLHAVASALHRTYDDAGGVLDSIQPPALARCFPMSLDEWEAELAGAVQELDALEAFYSSLEPYRFEPELAGGGCVILSAYRGDGHVWLTCVDGGGYPTPDSWMVGVYAPGSDGEAVWTLSSEQAGAGLELFGHAVQMAVATAEALADAVEDGGAR